MKEKFVNSSISFINKYQECDDLKIKKLRYGLEGIYSLIVKISIVILISLLTGTLKETSLFLLFYAGIRTFSFGWHAKSNIACWITTITVYNIIPLLSQNLVIPNSVMYVILVVCFISMLCWAPADTPKRPLIRKKQRMMCKKITLSTTLIYTLLILTNIVKPINNIIIYALLIQSILINPITYKLTKTQFNNYKYYHKKSNMV